MKISKLIIRSIVLISYFLSGVVFAQNNDSFLLPPEVIVLPEKANNHSVINRKFTGIPSMAISNGGEIWTVWYAGITPNEDKNNYVIVSSSSDDGNNWIEKLIIDPDGDGQIRAFDPELWIDPTGKLWVFWAQSIGHEGTVAGVWAITSVNPESDSPKWTEPKRLTNGIMMCKPTVLSNGDWVLPAST
jgi:BNR repeat protein